ncbi:hypothetical protein [Deinococcus wulumuqiensis]|nr:hypothetical protein [Deinococcus wulumuqiensis]
MMTTNQTINRREGWALRRSTFIPAVPAVKGEDTFTELLSQVQRDYVRLSDVETLQLARVCWAGGEHAEWAADMLSRNAGPIVLEVAYFYSTRFGGLLEAYDAAWHTLSKLLPEAKEVKVPNSDKTTIRKTGWNGEKSGLRFLSWVERKLYAEMPTAAQRLVDEKRESGAPAAIAAGRSRVLYTVGNDAELYDWLMDEADRAKTQPRKGMPGGRKNLIVAKGGDKRFSRKATAKAVAALTASLQSKAQAVKGEALILQPHVSMWESLGAERWDIVLSLGAKDVAHLPVTPKWVAAAVRAGARATLRKPGLGERTEREALALSRVGEGWVARNSKAARLDALVGNDQDERLADIIAATEPQEAARFEVSLHKADENRAFRAYKQYGPVYGPILLSLPVRELLPVQRRRKQEAEVRERFQAFCERAGLSGKQQMDAIAAARLAAHELGLDPKKVSAGEARVRFQGVQDALRGRKPVGKKGQLGFALSAALSGTKLAEVSSEEAKVAKALRKAFPKLKWGFSLAAALVFGRKLNAQGKADRQFVEACRKAGVRVKLAAEALEMVKDVPTATRKGERVRVCAGKPYLRSWQRAIEAEVWKVEGWANQTRAAQLALGAEAQAANAAIDAAPNELWVAAMDKYEPVAFRAHKAAKVAGRYADRLALTSEILEDCAARVDIAWALNAMLEAEASEYEAHCAANPNTWWADAYAALSLSDVPF